MLNDIKAIWSENVNYVYKKECLIELCSMSTGLKQGGVLFQISYESTGVEQGGVLFKYHKDLLE